MIGYSDIMKALLMMGCPHELCHWREKTNIPPLLLAGEGWGEAEGGPLASGYNFTPSPAALRPPTIRIFLWTGYRRAAHPVFSDLCKASHPALYQNLIAGCRRATERDFSSPLPATKMAGSSTGERKGTYFLRKSRKSYFIE